MMRADDLPKSLRNAPYMRALGLRVYPHQRNSMIVTGGSRPHEIFAYPSGLKCDCTAAQFGRKTCKHIEAVELLKMQFEKGKPMGFTLDRSVSDFKPAILLPTHKKVGYAGLFSRYSVKSGQYGDFIIANALITHAATAKGYEKLDAITEGVVFLNTKWSHSNKYTSQLISLASALSQMSPQKLYDEIITPEQMTKLFNELVGCGFTFSASVEANKNDPNALSNVIDKDSFDRPDVAFQPIADKMREKCEIKLGSNGYAYIASPQPARQEEAPTTSPGAYHDHPNDLDNEVPF